MFAKLKERIRNFVKDVKAAIRRFFGLEEKKQPIDIEVVTETRTDEEGNIVITKTEKVNSTPTWSDIWQKAKLKVRTSIDAFLEHPARFSIGGLTVFGFFRAIAKPISKWHDSYERSHTLYNDKTHMNYKLKRRLTRREQNAVNRVQAAGGNIDELLDSYGVLY